jgi:hypothetical protein
MTVGLGALGSTPSLIIIVIPTMLTLSLLLAVAPMRWIVASALTAIAIDLAFMTYYFV